MANLLLLGEGDFSFSHDLCQIVADSLSSPAIAGIVATSFDARCDLLQKYSNIEKTLRNLTLSTKIQVIHGVDATKNLRSQLTEASCMTSDFDHIVFNFPHLGYEDLKAHTSLIAHVLFRANEMLFDSPPHASFYLTLAQSQAENWNLKEMALRNGMMCYDEVPFMQQLWPSYQLKRHHSGKSFGSRVQNCVHYCLRRISPAPMQLIISIDSPGSSMNIFRYLSGTLLHKKDFDQKLCKSGSQEERKFGLCAEAVTPLSATGSDQKLTAIKHVSKKKRKVDNLVEGSYTKVDHDGIAIDSSHHDISLRTTTQSAQSANISSSFIEECWRCNACARDFKSEQGVKTHVYMVHVLAFDTKDTSASPGGFSLTCDDCGKVSSNSDAHRQHTLAKHSGQFQSIKPSWAAHSDIEGQKSHFDDVSVPPRVVESAFECTICGSKFDTAEILESHMLGWQPVTSTSWLSCVRCLKGFRDERALKQHMNCCNEINAKSV